MQALQPIPPPLAASEDGVYRVGGTRVTLDSVAISFQAGATPEEIVQQYPSLRLADVYAVVAYILNSPDEVEAYLSGRAKVAEQVRAENERRFPSVGIRTRLMARSGQ